MQRAWDNYGECMLSIEACIVLAEWSDAGIVNAFTAQRSIYTKYREQHK